MVMARIGEEIVGDYLMYIFEPRCQKTHRQTCAPSSLSQCVCGCILDVQGCKDYTHAQADLSLCLAYIVYWFCHALAHLSITATSDIYIRTGLLTLSTLDNNFNRQHFEILFVFHFMQIFFNGITSLHEMSKPVSWEK